LVSESGQIHGADGGGDEEVETCAGQTLHQLRIDQTLVRVVPSDEGKVR
jgi:hypothetical protein